MVTVLCPPSPPLRPPTSGQRVSLPLVPSDPPGSRRLTAELTRPVGKRVAASPAWPKNVSTFGNELRRLAPQLRLHGLFIDIERRHDGRIVTLS